MRVDLAHVHKWFGSVHANDDITLAIRSGSIHGLLGENGAGKTTLMKTLSGYHLADAGSIALDGQLHTFGSPEQAIQAGIGMLHQDPLDVPAFRVLDNFLLGHETGLFTPERAGRRDLARLCMKFGFALDPDAPTNSLTMGERQQLELVRLLSLGVRTIILDEPTTGISAPQKELLFRTLKELAGEGLSIIFVSHKLEDVQELCHEATVLRNGRISGQNQAPFNTDHLVDMMFGQSLSTWPRHEAEQGEIALCLEQVSIATHRLRIQDISLSVRQGEVIGLAGLEGSGQRLLMRACCGLEHVRHGHISVGGVDMTHRSYHQYLDAQVAYVPAARLEEGMIGSMTIREHIALEMDSPGLMVRWPQATALAQERIEAYNVIGKPETLVHELSGGNQQRMLLALLPDDLQVLMLEHPTRGLDLESVRWVWRKLLQRRNGGTAILFTSTDLDELVENSDRIVVFSGGSMSRPVDATTISGEDLGYMIGGIER